MSFNLLDRIAKADQLKSVDAIKKSVEAGTIPGFIGWGMINQLVENAEEAKSLAQGAPNLTVVDQINQKAQALAQPIPQQIPPQNPQPPREMVAGIDAAQSNLPTQNMADGGIVAFAGENGSLVDDEYDPYEDEDNEEYYADMDHQSKLAQLIAEDEALTEGILDDDMLGAAPQGIKNAGTGVKYKEPIPTSGIKADQYSGDKDQARKYNVGNLRPSGFTYKGQVGVSPGGFAMFDSREAGIAALNQDINAKLNRGLDTPTKFISVYAPASDKNDVGAYSANVAKALGIGPNDKIPNTPEARQLLANAITRQEGAQYATARFAAGGDVKSYSGTGPDKSQVSDDSLKDNEYLQRSRGVTEGIKNLGSGLYNAFTTPRNYDLYDLYQRGIGRPFAQSVSNFVNEPLESQAARFRSYSMTPNQTPTVGYAVPAGSDVSVPTSTTVNAPNKASQADVRKSEERIAEKATKYAAEDAAKIRDKADQTFDSTGSQAKAEQTLFQQMQDAFKKREAALESEKSIDNYLAILQGFLGMMGGTSPYAMVNIGQGASSGISTLLAARKQQGLAERALGRDQMSLLNAQASQDYKNAVLGQNERKINALAANNRLLEANRVRDDYLSAIQKWEKNNTQLLNLRNNLLGLQAKGKLSKDQQTQLNQIDRQIADAEDAARKATGFGVESSGWGVKVVQPGSK